VAGHAPRGHLLAAPRPANYVAAGAPRRHLAVDALTPADRLIADAVAAVIRARITATLDEHMPEIDARTAAHIATDAARQAVADLRRDGWHITALPTNTPVENR